MTCRVVSRSFAPSGHVIRSIPCAQFFWCRRRRDNAFLSGGNLGSSCGRAAAATSHRVVCAPKGDDTNRRPEEEGSMKRSNGLLKCLALAVVIVAGTAGRARAAE